MNIKHTTSPLVETGDRIAFGLIQIVIGAVLFLCSLYGFSVVQNNIVMLPTFMSIALLGSGVYSLLTNLITVDITNAA